MVQDIDKTINDILAIVKHKPAELIAANGINRYDPPKHANEAVIRHDLRELLKRFADEEIDTHVKAALA